MDTNTPSAAAPANIEDIKPDLQNKSSAMAVVKGVTVGAVIGAALTLGLTAIPAARRYRYPNAGFKEAFKKLIVPMTAVTAVADGGLEFLGVSSANNVKDAARPYVERLEAERSALASRLAEVGGGVQKG